MYYEESLASSNLNSKQLRFHCAHPNIHILISLQPQNAPFFQVFVKGRRDDFMAHPEEALHWGSEVFPSEKDFQMMAKSYLRSGFSYKIDRLI